MLDMGGVVEVWFSAPVPNGKLCTALKTSRPHAVWLCLNILRIIFNVFMIIIHVCLVCDKKGKWDSRVKPRRGNDWEWRKAGTMKGEKFEASFENRKFAFINFKVPHRRQRHLSAAMSRLWITRQFFVGRKKFGFYASLGIVFCFLVARQFRTQLFVVGSKMTVTQKRAFRFDFLCFFFLL